ncbi:MAG TPA: class I SAM-dependent methyltransferase [Phycisphaerales bacterium]|nr:class I SAM-dependent methyltransferase [Phycisphaerales bacterium]HMP37079.1 class I SAM-dependent methyltransferase [Phycisphaerales bacterium]
MSAPATIDDRREAERQKYLALGKRTDGRYGSSNHGRRAMVSVLLRQPRFVVDFGCGSNDFIHELRRRGADGLGIDFADDRADILAPMHAVPLAAGIADVVTSFDALEHLLPEDIDSALAEMRRVARPGAAFVLSISTRPSRITAHGDNLHPTVRPRSWWLERIARVGQVERGSPYIEGVFNA